MEKDDVYEFDVFTSPHEDVKKGVIRKTRSRVLISRKDFPSYPTAVEVAANLAVAIHGGMPTEVLPRY